MPHSLTYKHTSHSLIHMYVHFHTYRMHILIDPMIYIHTQLQALCNSFVTCCHICAYLASCTCSFEGHLIVTYCHCFHGATHCRF